MKLFLILIGMVAAGFLGYSFEPQLRQQLTGESPSEETDKEQPAGKEVVINTTAPSATIDPATYSADQLPEKIQLRSDVEVSNENGDLKMTITAGNKVNLIRIEGQNVVISPGAGPFEGSVPINQTDLIEQLTALGAKPKEEVDMPVVEEEKIEETKESETESDPKPKAPTGPVDIVEVMQSSIKNGEIKEFTFDKVLDWNASEEPETIDGESYQTGIASYKAETVFGVKTIQAKALIKDGVVVRWLWPKSGLEIE